MPVEFRDPPGRPRPPGVWEGRLRPLLQAPGRWAVVYRSRSAGGAAVTAHRLRYGRLQGIPPGRFDFRSDQDGHIYAIYLGP